MGVVVPFPGSGRAAIARAHTAIATLKTAEVWAAEIVEAHWEMLTMPVTDAAAIDFHSCLADMLREIARVGLADDDTSVATR